MANTTPDNLYYPDEDTAVDDLDAVLGAMQASTQLAINNLRSSVAPTVTVDTGWSLTGLSLATGWGTLTDPLNRTVAPFTGGIRRVGSTVELRFRGTRTGAALTAGQGASYGDVQIGTVTNTTLRPQGPVYGLWNRGPGHGYGAIRVNEVGRIDLVDGPYAYAELATGTVCAFQMTYLLG